MNIGERIRALRNAKMMTQTELAGKQITRNMLSRIENGSARMNWSHLTSVMFVVVCNRRTKAYFYANDLLDERFLQFMQQKDANIPPEVNIVVDVDGLRAYAQRK